MELDICAACGDTIEHVLIRDLWMSATADIHCERCPVGGLHSPYQETR